MERPHFNGLPLFLPPPSSPTMTSSGKTSSSSSPLLIQLLSATTLLLQLSPSPVASYPIFGTKRYHRGGQQSLQQFPPYAVPPQQPLYTPYDLPLDTYYSSDDPSNYLYYAPAPSDAQFGMPVYHGDYKPSPYLYAQGPTYQYYDDKEATNPLDDLHEEMLEEDEREREEREHEQQQQMRQYAMKQQLNHHPRQPQRHQPLLREDYAVEPLTKHRGYGYQVPLYQTGGVAQQQSTGEYADDESGVGDSNSYAQANAAFLNDLIQYNRQISRNAKGQTAHAEVRNRNVQPARREYNANWNFDYPAQYEVEDEVEAQQEQMAQQLQDEYDYDAFVPLEQATETVHHQHRPDDKAVRELQALTHSRDKTSSHSAAPPPAMDPMADEYFWSGGASALDKDTSELSGQMNNYEYEDGGDEWINWDSKRSGGGASGNVKPISILAFTDRKPSKVVKVPENHFVLEGQSGDKMETSTSVAGESKEAKVGKDEKVVGITSGKTGQKEEVLMRPAPPVRNPFSAPVMKMLEHQESLKTSKYENHASVEDLENMKKRTVKEDSPKGGKPAMYEAIKQWLDMEQQLKEVSLRYLGTLFLLLRNDFVFMLRKI